MIVRESTDNWNYSTESTFQTYKDIIVCDICDKHDDAYNAKTFEIDMSYRDENGKLVRKHLDVCQHCVDNSLLYQRLTA